MEGHSFNYVDCDVPEGMTLDEYRRARGPVPRRGLRSWLRAHWPAR
ncbi:MAG TPA: hypothetical protein VK279_07055 [Solirubrobacteraceae bacterium]|nr:hypothetical protein [Solirubrobacteraceae bacterium]